MNARLFMMAAAAQWAAALGATAAWAQSIPEEPLQRRCWQSYSAQRTSVDLREPVSVTFSNLKSGYVVRSPFWVEFAIRGMGVVPAGNQRDKAGHHHILVDRTLPADHRAKLPFDDSHRHFGKGHTGHFAVTIGQGGKVLAQQAWTDGRTESVLDLPRGDVEVELSFLGADGKTLMQGQPLRLSVARASP